MQSRILVAASGHMAPRVGIAAHMQANIEAGYTYVPITAKATSSNPILSGEKDYNFGGAQIRLLLAF